jgi:MFS family permease
VVGEIERGHWRATRTPDIAMRGMRPMRSFLSQTAQLVRRHPGRVALGCTLDFSEAAGYYGLFAFLPLFILPQLHVGPQFVPWFYLVGNVGALIGGFAVVLLLDCSGRKLTVPALYLLAAGGVLLLAAATATHDWRWVLAAFTLANLFATGAWISAYPTFSEIFPTGMRSTGIGLSIAVGRIGAFGAPLALTATATFVGMMPALALLAGFWLIGAAAMIPWFFFGVEGRHRTLEQMVASQTMR